MTRRHDFQSTSFDTMNPWCDGWRKPANEIQDVAISTLLLRRSQSYSSKRVISKMLVACVIAGSFLHIFMLYQFDVAQIEPAENKTGLQRRKHEMARRLLDEKVDDKHSSSSLAASFSSPVERPFCHLSDLEVNSKSIYLWTMIPANGRREMHGIIGHFIAHYETNGIPKENMFFQIHAIGDAFEDRVKEVYAILKQHGILNVQNQSSIENRLFHSNVKREQVNHYIRQLPQDAWMVYADLDELFVFSCKLPQYGKIDEKPNANNHPVMCGRMTDRLAKTLILDERKGHISAAAIPLIDWSLERPIQEQFSSCALIRNGYLKKTANHKILLFPTRIARQSGQDGKETIFVAKYTSAHDMLYVPEEGNSTAIEKVAADCRYNGAINHYAWSAEALGLVQMKLLTYDKWAKLKKNIGGRRKVYIDLLRMVEKREMAGTNNVTESSEKRWFLSKVGKRAMDAYAIPCPEAIQSESELSVTRALIRSLNNKKMRKN